MQTNHAMVARQEGPEFWENPMRNPGCQWRKVLEAEVSGTWSFIKDHGGLPDRGVVRSGQAN